MRILLINPIIRISHSPSYFPLGLAYIAGVLAKEGHDIEVLDINAFRYSPREVESKIKREVCDWVGITGLVTEYKQIKWLTEVIRKYHPSKKIVLGGGLPSSAPKFVLEKTEADIVVIGEGESTVEELSKAIENDDELRNVSGIAFKENGNICRTASRPSLEFLDDIPFPAWGLFPTEIYIGNSKIGFEHPARSINMISSRGCPYECTYCFHGIFGHHFRCRSPQNIIEEIEFLKDKYRIDGVVFSDDLFVLNKKRIYDFCEQLLSKNLQVRWMCNGRVDLMQKDLLIKAKSAGCCSIFYGIESGCQEILDDMKKQVTVEQSEKTVQMTREAGISVGAYFMIGTPKETEETFKQTVGFCKKMRLPVEFAFATPLPDTALFKYAARNGKVNDMESLLSRWSIWNNNLLVNLTQLPDEKLIAMKQRAEEEVNSFLFPKERLARFICLAKNMIEFFRVYGLPITLRRIIYKLPKLIGLKIDHNSRMLKAAKLSMGQWDEIL